MVLPQRLRDEFQKIRHQLNVGRVERRFLDLFDQLEFYHQSGGGNLYVVYGLIDQSLADLKQANSGDCVVNEAVARVLQRVFPKFMKDGQGAHILLCTNVLVDKFDKNGWDQSAATLREKLIEEGALIPQMQSKGSGVAFFHQGVVFPDEEVSTAPPEFSV